MSPKTSDYLEDEELQRPHEALDSLGIDCPKNNEETLQALMKFSDIEVRVSNLIIKWDVHNSLSMITKLKVNHSSLDTWIDELQRRICPSWLRKVITGPLKFERMVSSFGEGVGAEDRPICWY